MSESSASNPSSVSAGRNANADAETDLDDGLEPNRGRDGSGSVTAVATDVATDAAPGETSTARATAVQELSRFTLPLMWLLRQDAVRAFEPLGVRPIQALALELIDRGLLHPKRLAEVLDTNPPAISSLLSELDDHGWIARDPDPDDRRRVLLRLTGRGRERLATLRRRWLELADERLAAIATDDLQTVVHVYRDLLGAAHADPNRADDGGTEGAT